MNNKIKEYAIDNIKNLDTSCGCCGVDDDVNVECLTEAIKFGINLCLEKLRNVDSRVLIVPKNQLFCDQAITSVESISTAEWLETQLTN